MGSKLTIPEGGVFNVGANDNGVNNVDNNVNTNVNKSVNNVNITIKRKEDDFIDDPIRQTYYLKPSTIRRIKKMSRQADMGVSEFLQTILDNVLDNIKIE